MNTAIRIEVMPARLGDCLLVECARQSGQPWRMLVDGGPPGTWPRLEPDDRHIDVAVVTHIDSDHVGGMLPFLQSEYAEHVRDHWFNGAKQGNSLVASLLEEREGPVLPWHRAFGGGGAINTGDEAGFIEVPVPDGPRITVLSPTCKRLAIPAHEWLDTIAQAKCGSQDEIRADALEPLDDLAAIAAQQSSDDTSAPNGGSIALLPEHRGARVVLGADAFGNALGAGLAGLAAGEPKRALVRVTPSHQKPRITAALTAWARQLDGNWYPGDVAAETRTELEGVLVEAQPSAPDEEILEEVVQNGPVGLRVPVRLRAAPGGPRGGPRGVGRNRRSRPGPACRDAAAPRGPRPAPGPDGPRARRPGVSAQPPRGGHRPAPVAAARRCPSHRGLPVAGGRPGHAPPHRTLLRRAGRPPGTGVRPGPGPAHLPRDELRADASRFYGAGGGDPEANADGRRGLDLNPRLRDTEETPEPLGGDAERYWAPFVLV
ncbi:hypothetical protein OG457_44360 [Streptomyces sp. NBC_01207]|nr:hypothetical protein OG457_44360 [Streptomyces sp. NBC_01207]WTA23862.1 hypothetical protein OG365_38030 [Streptomyces sp. NBC_00853]